MSDTGGGGVGSTTENSHGGVTTTVTWHTGLTSIETITKARVLSGTLDKCAPPKGYRNDSEVKWTSGKVTGGTAHELVGGRTKSTVCVYSQGPTLLVENFPGTDILF